MAYQIGTQVTFEKMIDRKWVEGVGRVVTLMYGVDDARIIGRVNGKRIQFDVLQDTMSVRNLKMI